MPADPADLEALRAPKSAARRSAAKRLRKAGDEAAGPALLEALRLETDPRTWETQYQLIMALGECKYSPARAYLIELAARTYEATILYLALGDARVRLAGDAAAMERDVLDVLADPGCAPIRAGAFRAVAMLRLVPGAEARRAMIQFARTPEGGDNCRFWAAAAAAGWRGPEVEVFLDECAASPTAYVREAAQLSREHRYKNWNPL